MKKIVKLSQGAYNELLEILASSWRSAYFTDEEFDDITNYRMEQIERIFEELEITQEDFNKLIKR